MMETKKYTMIIAIIRETSKVILRTFPSIIEAFRSTSPSYRRVNFRGRGILRSAIAKIIFVRALNQAFSIIIILVVWVAPSRLVW